MQRSAPLSPCAGGLIRILLFISFLCFNKESKDPTGVGNKQHVPKSAPPAYRTEVPASMGLPPIPALRAIKAFQG